MSDWEEQIASELMAHTESSIAQEGASIIESACERRDELIAENERLKMKIRNLELNNARS